VLPPSKRIGFFADWVVIGVKVDLAFLEISLMFDQHLVTMVTYGSSFGALALPLSISEDRLSLCRCLLPIAVLSLVICSATPYRRH
jgi:hypothetical protein